MATKHCLICGREYHVVGSLESRRVRARSTCSRECAMMRQRERLKGCDMRRLLDAKQRKARQRLLDAASAQFGGLTARELAIARWAVSQGYRRGYKRAYWDDTRQRRVA